MGKKVVAVVVIIVLIGVYYLYREWD